MNEDEMEKLIAEIKETLADLEPEAKPTGWVELRVPRERWYETAMQLRDADHLKLHYLANITAVDWIEDARFELVGHLLNLETGAKLVLKTDVPRDDAHVASLTPLWPTADWQEREVWDMFGIWFDKHPDLRRILMKEGWPGHPLRKDYEDWRPVRERKTKETYDPSLREGQLPAVETGS